MYESKSTNKVYLKPLLMKLLIRHYTNFFFLPILLFSFTLRFIKDLNIRTNVKMPL